MSDPVIVEPAKSEIPAHTPEPPNLPAYETIVPAEFKDKEYLKDVKDIPSLFKKLDGAQTLIGKRPAGIPQDNAKPEEWTEFNKAFGVPEAPDKYELVVPEKDPMPKEMLDGIKGVFHKAGLNAKQAKAVSEGWNELMPKMAEALGVKAKADDAAFEQLATEVFGEKKDETLASSKAILEKFVPEKFKEHVNNLSNENLIVLASVIDGIKKEYISEDRIPGRGDAKAQTPADKRAAGMALMGSEAYQNPFHPEHAATKAKVEALYGTGSR